MGILSKIFKSRMKDWIYAPLDATQVPGSSAPALLTPDQAYINVTLNSFRIVDVRKGLSKFYGVVHSSCDIKGLSGATTFNLVTTPSALAAVDSSKLDRVLTMQKRLLGPVPYRGGDVNIEIGLFSIKEADLAGPFLSILEDLSGLAGTAFIKAALPFAQPLQKGVELLTGSGDQAILEIGLARSYLEGGIKTGHFVLMRAEKDTVDTRSLKVDPADYKVAGPDGKAVADYPYLLFEISATRERTDWFSIPALKEAYDKLMEAVKNGDAPGVQERMAAFRLTAMTSDDLLQDDGEALAKKVKTRIEGIMGSATTGGGRAPKLPELRDISPYGP